MLEVATLLHKMLSFTVAQILISADLCAVYCLPHRICCCELPQGAVRKTDELLFP